MSSSVTTTNTEIQRAKETWCGGFNAVYGNEHKVTPDDEHLFFNVKPCVDKKTKKVFPGMYTVLISRDHPAHNMCLTMKSGCHKSSRQSRTYTVNINTGAIWQKCWSKQCLQRANKGRMILVQPADDSDSETESEDSDAPPTFTTVTASTSSKKRKRA